ncbi:hypothetical protein [Catenuloplanes japonicus]|uniref:hypothetical protein n=1 Tax=Catenuloplanes japonicus TaxID=33876 RepID=UPI000524F659|nr:hypothetical protein [Catenuloplanes japonicus]
MLRHLINAVTYRTPATDDRGALVARPIGGGRIRYGHPDLPALFEARRERMIRDGLDTADMAMLDAGTRLALENTMRRMVREKAFTNGVDSRWQVLAGPVEIVTDEDAPWYGRFGAAA